MSDRGDTEGLRITLGPKMALIEKSEYMMMTLWSNFRNWWDSHFDPSYLYSAGRSGRHVGQPVSSNKRRASFHSETGWEFLSMSLKGGIQSINLNCTPIWSFLAINRINGRSGSINWRKSVWPGMRKFNSFSSLLDFYDFWKRTSFVTPSIRF